MAVCFNNVNNRYEYCASYLSTYIAVGIIIPISILIIIALVYVYFRCKQRRLRRGHQQTYMATVVPMYNNDDQQQVSFNYSYPPHYASMSEDVFDKPPSYEQTVQQISERNINHDLREDRPAILPMTTTTTPSSLEPVESTRNQY